MVNIPSYVFTVVKRLESSGFQAYLAGGCVRDSIMNIAPNDYDITTNVRRRLKTYSGTLSLF